MHVKKLFKFNLIQYLVRVVFKKGGANFIVKKDV